MRTGRLLYVNIYVCWAIWFGTSAITCHTYNTWPIPMHLNIHCELSSFNSKRTVLWRTGLQSAPGAGLLIRKNETIWQPERRPSCSVGHLFSALIRWKIIVQILIGPQHPKVDAYMYLPKWKVNQMETISKWDRPWGFLLSGADPSSTGCIFKPFTHTGYQTQKTNWK